MNYSGKKILIVGMARSGFAAAKALLGCGACVTVNDLKPQDAFNRDKLKEIEGCSLALGADPSALICGMDMIVISPGIPIDSKFILEAKEKGIKVIGEVELAYTLCPSPVYAITGTNGKTTTTALTGKMFDDAGRVCHVVGNIGIPYIEYATKAEKDSVMVAEISSFQLESTETFAPRAAAVLNLTEDHLNRHKTMRVYGDTKKRIFENQTENDYAVLNYDYEETRSMAKGLKSKVVYFSAHSKIDGGVYVSDTGMITASVFGKAEEICHRDEVKIIGPHNLENALCATALAYIGGISPANIGETLKTFEGVEHRLEFVREYNGVKYINDSKGTNPDATIKAVQSMTAPTVLIAGGYDKGSDFASLIRSFNENIIHMVILGNTAQKLKKAALDNGFEHITYADTFEAAVQIAGEKAKTGGTVLLSPACASFDMFSDYEERGRVFKEIVNSLGKG